MRKLIIIAAGVASFLAFSAPRISAQVTATGHVFAEVIDAISAGETTPMDFGSFTPGTQGGSIVVNSASGNAIATSTVVPASTAINPATFTLSGTSGAAFSVKLPTSPITLTSTTGSGTLTVSDWEATSGQGTETFILVAGTQTVNVGATLNVGSADVTPTGFYTGSYQVTFAYN